MTSETIQAAWHSRTTEETLKALACGPEGLSSAEAGERLALHGPNVLKMGGSESLFKVLWRQINNPISWLLVAAGILSVSLGKTVDSIVVFGAVVINAVIGFVQEVKAGRAISALSSMVPENAAVLRDGRSVTIPVSDLVPGDVVTLAGGDKVPADLRLLKTRNLRVEEAALTGESVPVEKIVDPVADDAPLGDRTCLAFGGTLVTQGTATGAVVATGSRTELGHINALLQKTHRLETPLTRQLAVVSGWITAGVIAVSVALFLFGVLVKDAKIGEALFTAVTLAVAAIPEGLPAIITIALAIGVQRMASRRAVIRHLPAVETLGSTSVICSDKTGTLTRNEMKVVALWDRHHEYRLTGTGYSPEGVLQHDDAPVADPPGFVRDLVLAGSLCSDATLTLSGKQWIVTGDPTEAALVVAGRKLGYEESEVRRTHPRRDVLPFESDTKYMATWNEGGGINEVFMKGAIEVLIPRCTLDESGRRQALSAQESLARQGMRVMAFARRSPDTGMSSLTDEWASRGFEFLGLMGMIDPPRQEAIDAIAVCHQAGIAVKMITGDHPVTAAAIGGELGLIDGESRALTGKDLDRLDEEGFRQAARSVHIFARVAPEHKIRLVSALQADGNVVAMTGDGVNDAPALKRADIGVAMGITGTSVSKEAAKVVLTDDNFASIAAAVEEGRRVYDNLIKALAFILPTNLGLAGILAAAVFFFPTVEVTQIGHELLLPMSPTQILWINLVASVLLSLPIAFEVLEKNAMKRPPRPRSAPVFSRFVVIRTLLVALLITVGSCLLFLWEYFRFVETVQGPTIPNDLHRLALAEAQTVCVTTVTLFQCFYLLHCRSLKDRLGALGWFSNPVLWLGISLLLLLQLGFIYLPFMQTLFRSAPLDLDAWWRSTLAASSVLLVISLEKRLWRHQENRVS